MARILIIDDEVQIRAMLRQVLERSGYDVSHAPDGKVGMKLHWKKPADLIITDIIMPKMGGGEAYDRMKEINPNVKVLLSSGYSIDGPAREILKRGCDAFIQKPFSMKELSQAIREVLGKE